MFDLTDLKNFDLKQLDPTKLDLTRFDLRSIDPRNIDLARFDLPKFDTHQLPGFDLPEFDMAGEVTRVAEFARDAAYAGVGAVVVTAQRATAQVRKLVETVS